MLKLAPKSIGDKPPTPSLVEKMDLLTYHYNEANRLRKEVEHEWVELNRADQERFQVIQKTMLLRKQESESQKRDAKHAVGKSEPKTRKQPAWKSLVFEE